MPSAGPSDAATSPATESPAASEILLTPDGRILAHHLTPELAAVLHHLSAPMQSLATEPQLPEASNPNRS